jgi:hypothetical protein
MRRRILHKIWDSQSELHHRQQRLIIELSLLPWEAAGTRHERGEKERNMEENKGAEVVRSLLIAGS